MNEDNKPLNPPSWVMRFLQTICPNYLIEEIEGDLIQKFNRDIKIFGGRKAKRRLVWNAIRFFRPGIVFRNTGSINLNALHMLSNYFTVAYRVMLRSKAFSLLNISGLSLGITGAMLLFIWIDHEMSYDQFHVAKERIYKAWNNQTENGHIRTWDLTPRVLAPTLMQEIPGLESAISYGAYQASYLFTVGETKILKSSGVFTDPEFLTMFSFPLIKGDPAKALDNPNEIVLTESFARELFKGKEPLGEVVTIEESGNRFEFIVNGILKDLPPNTDFHFDYLISWQFLESVGQKDTYWGNNSVSTFVKVLPGQDISQLNQKVRDIAKNHAEEGSKVEIFLYPLTRMHLYGGFENGIPSGGRIEIIRMLGILGFCLIAIACINFINLSTARAQRRFKEVGIRKVNGAYRVSLIIQFLCESVLIAFCAAVVSLGIVFLVLPSFNQLVQQQLTLHVQDISFWIKGVAFILLIGIIAGSYPAFVLSSFHPVRILKGVPGRSGNRNVFRQLLVVFQFGFAVTLIVSVIVISKQIGFVQDRDAGYAKDNLIYHQMTGEIAKNFQAYKNELLSSGIATSVTKTSSPITDRWSNTDGMNWKGKDPQENPLIERFYVDDNISTTVGLTILEGRDMNLEKYPSDSTAVLLNETAVKLMGFENPVGEIIEDNDIEWHVIGVVRDFILTSPLNKIPPMTVQGAKKDMFDVIHIRLNDNNTLQSNMKGMSTLFSKFNSAYPFTYHFVDQVYERKFSNLRTTLKITGLFGGMTIVIACLGLLGLSTFMIESRVKEIGIRKILGGSITSIIKLLCMDSLKPILLAIGLFSPMAWFSMNWWLQSFDYRISLGLSVFIIAAVAMIVIALITILAQTFTAARANPVNNLRSE
ncbi:MAG TPA: ABC transporter permease [Ohtaekwangia sp.]|nr:ABC transporter permease [Ohtaekwangia sp.]